ncbi:unnamed protein product [Anisakis simplex]|uniref:F-box domain-containing protein n=1 Tax=Anisakis simplex TaxID=6269 RepID=A0A0M3JZZ3_ANISI|nr:unnamed protein product [Anisakis simplex]
MTDEADQCSSSVNEPFSTYRNGCSIKECCSNESCTCADGSEMGRSDGSPEECVSGIETMPDVVMQCVFESFDLKERAIASQVCQRWHYLLTGRFPMEDVTVLNIFQNNIYKDKISCNKSIGLKCYHIKSADMLLSILQHCHSVSSVKIWFWSSTFAGEILSELCVWHHIFLIKLGIKLSPIQYWIRISEMLKQMNIKMRCLDLYPYRAEKALYEAFSTFPDLTGMTMRPHGQDYFWTGLDLMSFPNFGKLDTLMLDGFNIHQDVFLPKSLTTLEWLNRSGHFMVIMPKLKALINLEYLMLGHAEFANSDEFDSFLKTISSENLPKLQYLVMHLSYSFQIFRYCKIDAHKTGSNDTFNSPTSSNDINESIRALSALNFSSLDISLEALQLIKFDLCYANLNYIINKILPFTGANFRAISLNVISEETNYDRIYEIAELMHSKKLMLHFGILQKDMKPERKEGTSPINRPPPAFGNVLARFEASFVTDESLLRTLLLSNPLPKMSDTKFIQASAVDNTLLFHLAMFAPRLRKLSLINCSEDKLDEGMVHFIAGFPSRLSKCFQIIWKRKRNRPAAFFLQLVNDHASLIKGYGARFFAKKFSANKDGERITIWDKKTMKALYIQDFDANDAGRILGIVMPPDDESSNDRFHFIDL